MLAVYNLEFHQFPDDYLGYLSSNIEKTELFFIDEGFNVVVSYSSKFPLQKIPVYHTNNPVNNFLVLHFSKALETTLATSKETNFINIFFVVSDKWIQHTFLNEIGISSQDIQKNLNELQNQAVIQNIAVFHASEIENQLPIQQFKNLYVRLWSLQLIKDVLDEISVFFRKNNHSKFRKEDILKVRQVEQEVKNMIERTLPNIEKMASMAGMSPTKFKEVFKEEFKESPHKHFLNIKFKVAKNLLESKKYTASQVAYKVGFNHPSALARLFKSKETKIAIS